MFSNFMSAIFHFFQSIHLYGAFLSMFIENIGIPLPTEIGYLIGQDLINRGAYSYPVVLSVLSLGHIIGSVISYRVGRLGDSYIAKKLKQTSKIRDVQTKLENWYKKYGNWTVFLTRFVGYVRPWSSFVAGFSKTEFGPFLLWTSVGSVIFNVLNLYFSQIFIMIWRRYSVYHVLIISVAAFFFFGLLVFEAARYLISLFRSKNK